MSKQSDAGAEDQPFASAALTSKDTPSSQQKNYGSTAESGDKNPTFGSSGEWNRKLEEWGAPLELLLYAWIAAIPIIVPLFVAGYEMTVVGSLMCRCDVYFPDGFNLKFVICVVTYSATSLFPPLCRVLALCLVTHIFVRQRLFYVLLKKQILLILDDRGIFAWTVVAIEMVFLSAAMVHFSMGIVYGYEKDSDGEVLLDSPVMKTSVSELLFNPQVVFEEHCHYLLTTIVKMTNRYIGPALVAIAFTLRCRLVYMTVLPLTTIFESEPYDACQHFAKSVAVHEFVACHILSACDQPDESENESSAAARQIRDRDLVGACEVLRREALTFDGVSVIGCNPDMERPTGTRLASPPSLELLNFASLRWWQLEIILKDDMSETMQFRKIWAAHCVALVFLISFEIIMACFRCYTGYMDVYHSDTGWCWHSEAFASFCDIVFSIGLLRMLHGLIKNVLHGFH